MFKKNIGFIVSCIFVGYHFAHASEYSVFQCKMPGAVESNVLSDAYKWSANLEGAYTETEARQSFLKDCQYQNFWISKFTNHCENLAAKADCYQLESMICSGVANVYDNWKKHSMHTSLRLGVVYLPVKINDKDQAVRDWYKSFCPRALEQNLFGYRPAASAEEFCNETLNSLKCELP